MLKIEKNRSLKLLNSFGVDVNADRFFELRDKSELIELFNLNIDKFLVIGEGSNLLFRKDVEYLVIKNSIKGKRVVFESDEYIDIDISSGEIWNDIVLEYSKLGYGGIENLVKIPGNMGAAVVQNIGAYGVEIKDVVQSVDVFDTKDREFKRFMLNNLNFRYRGSIFKDVKDRYIVVSVIIRLIKNPKEFNIKYRGIEERLGSEISTYNIAMVISEIRSSKLPSPEILGNAGSFFKNPIVNNEKFILIQKKYPNMPFYNLENGMVKIPAAWLIETTGFKGFRKGRVGVYEKHALILVNYSDKNDDSTLIGEEIFMLSEDIIKKVNELFDIILEREVIVL